MGLAAQDHDSRVEVLRKHESFADHEAICVFGVGHCRLRGQSRLHFSSPGQGGNRGRYPLHGQLLRRRPGRDRVSEVPSFADPLCLRRPGRRSRRADRTLRDPPQPDQAGLQRRGGCAARVDRRPVRNLRRAGGHSACARIRHSDAREGRWRRLLLDCRTPRAVQGAAPRNGG